MLLHHLKRKRKRKQFQKKRKIKSKKINKNKNKILEFRYYDLRLGLGCNLGKDLRKR